MCTPGAPRSTVAAPKLEKAASPSFSSVAATATTFGSVYAAGYCGRTAKSSPSFPADTTNTTPPDPAASMVSFIATDSAPPPHELLSTRAPMSVA
jgi:hypothetical protein